MEKGEVTLRREKRNLGECLWRSVYLKINRRKGTDDRNLGRPEMKVLKEGE